MDDNNRKAIAEAIEQAPVFEKKQEGFLPDDCPISCLGTQNGLYYYITPLAQLRELKDKDHGSKQILSLFEYESSFLYQGRYARQNDKGDVTGWRSDDVARDLMATCAVKGIWEPSKKVRGTGAWYDDEENVVVLHCGNRIFKGKESFLPGVCGSFVYPSEPARQRPSTEPAAPKDFTTLLDLFKTWNWARPELDPYLLLGWIGAAFIGGALKWRPLLWITGDKGTGKSTLQDVISALFNGSLLSVSDPTPAGIWQSIKFSSLPVLLDEIEPEEDLRKVQAVIKLARQACSGGIVLRGSSEGKASEFNARNCYLFSSILIPPLLPQDRSRMAILELGSIDGKPPYIDKKELSAIGSRILRRMVDNYGAFRDNIELLRIGLSKHKLDSRGCDQFGTIIAAADILLKGGVMTSDDIDEWCELLKTLVAKERYENVVDCDACANYLFTSICDIYKDGKKRTIGDWISEAAGKECSKLTENCDRKEANRVLATYGLRVDLVEIDRDTTIEVLFIANNHQGLAKIFEKTHWQGGVWIQSFRRFSGAQAYGVRRFNGVASKCAYVPIDKLPLYEREEDALNIMACAG